MKVEEDFRKPVRMKSPLEKIIEKLKELDNAIKKDETYPTNSAEVIITMVQKFSQELEHERNDVIMKMIGEVHRMEALEFQRGRLYEIKRLQRDFDRG